MILDVHLDLYGFALKGVDFWGVAAEITLNPLGAVIIVNFYPFENTSIKKFMYIILSSLGFIIFEWISIQLGFSITMAGDFGNLPYAIQFLYIFCLKISILLEKLLNSFRINRRSMEKVILLFH